MKTFVARGLVAATFLATPLAFAAPPTIGGCQVFPANNHWNTPIDGLPVHADSAAILNQYGTARLRQDFGTTEVEFGIPYITVPGSQPLVPITFHPDGYPGESDPGPWPIPPNAPIEGTAAAPFGADRHVLVIETGNCILHELYSAFPQNGGASWEVFSSARWDLKSNALRPDTWTSADAAGLAVFAGLVRYEEVVAGEINHAIRMTLPSASNTYIWPARHRGPTGNTNPLLPKYGMRFRLKASVDISGFHPQAQVILRALKKYGFIFADQGSTFYFSGMSNPNWSSTMFSNIQSLVGRDALEIVDTSSLMATVNSGAVRSTGLRTDANADGRSDVIWRDNATGANYRWQLNGLVLTGQGYQPSVPTGWNIVGASDMNGDGRGDLLWRNATTGENYQWQMNGLTPSGQGYLPSVGSPWIVTGVGDANGDGRGDVLWRNPVSGQNYLWLLDGLAITAQGYLPDVPGAEWIVAGAADFNADRKLDVLWRNTVSGQVYQWQMNGFAVSGQGYLPTVTDPDWEVASTPDADGDGKADVLWRHRVSGANYLWVMDGLAVASQGYLPAVADVAWKIATVGDFDGDGRGDVLWRHAGSGANYLWALNGLVVTTQGYLPSVADTGWQPVK